MSAEKLLKFLFSDEEASLIGSLAEEFERADSLETENGSLKKVLGKLKVPTDGLEVDPEIGHVLTVDDADTYKEILKTLASPEGLTELGDSGWVMQPAGDLEGTEPEGKFQLRFMSLNDDVDDMEAEIKSVDALKKDLDKIATDSYDFQLKGQWGGKKAEPAEDEDSTDDENKGVGDAKDGSKPKGSLKK